MEDHTSTALANARRLRRAMTLPEVLLWQQLKGKQQGFRFRKQHPVGNFVLDFYCAAKRIAIELDGISHEMDGQPDRDLVRDRWLKCYDIRVLRIPAVEVLQDAGAIAESVIAYCAALPPPSAAGAAATSPSGGGFTGATT